MVGLPRQRARCACGRRCLEFCREGYQQRVARRLRRGGFALDGEVDLHGLSTDAAMKRLSDALRSGLGEGRRCLLMIHGKGFRSEGSHPILKNRVNLWLRQHPGVLAFCSAKPSDGGVGAVYVLLRNPRKSPGAHFA